MKEHVFIYQPGNIPGHRIIEELTGRGFKNPNEFFAMARGWYYTSFGNIYFTDSPIMIPGYTELTYEDGKFVEVKSWIPKLGDTYYTIAFDFQFCIYKVIECVWNDELPDKECLRHGCCFKTKELASQFGQKVSLQLTNIINF